MAAGEAPRPPYVLLFEEVAPGAPPLVILAGNRPAVPLFDSESKAATFAAATDFGGPLEPVEVSTAGLIRALETVREHAHYVALDPPPATGEGGMRVRMGSLEELVQALQSNPEDDLFGLLGGG